jgi:hypothetical protein
MGSKNLIVVAHGKILSFLNILSNHWIYHHEFESEIMQLMIHKRADSDYIIIVIFKNGSLRMQKFTATGEEEDQIEFNTNTFHELKGECIRYNNDRER